MHSTKILKANDSATRIENNTDLVTEILIRLPVKSLLRFKCVSRTWLSLISNPDFCHRRNHSLTISALLLLINPHSHHTSQYEILNLDKTNSFLCNKILYFQGIKILQSCCGLLLCCGYSPEQRSKNYYVYNPIITNLEKSFDLLPNQDGRFYSRIFGMVLAYDPLTSPHYKVIGVRRSRHKFHFVIDIFSSQTTSWKRFTGKTPFEEDECVDFNGGVFCNGVIFWKTGSENTLLCFELEIERVRKFAGPENGDFLSVRIDFIGASRRNFHVLCSCKKGIDYTEYFVYEMNHDLSGWILKYRFNFNAVAISCSVTKVPTSSELFNVFRVLAIVVAEKAEDSFLVFHMAGKLIRYNLNDKSFRSLYHFDPNIYGDFFMLGSSEVHGFMEMLA
ncbi:hypothetical protein CsatB_009064 [Cannabis sativa]